MSDSRHVALLRGINVGGNNIIKMVELRARFVYGASQRKRNQIQTARQPLVIRLGQRREQVVLRRGVAPQA